MQQVLQDRYRLTRHMSRTGAADVYQAIDLTLDRRVALKVLRVEAARAPGVADHFAREATAATHLVHPNVLTVLDVGRQGDVPFLVMEWMEWPNLARILDLEGPLPPWRVAEVGAQVALGLAYAHAQGVVHGGLKPTDVFVATNGEVKVGDFGIARATERIPNLDVKTAMRVATYLPPERARGLRADQRSDLYGLGVVLYEAATGRPPFTAETPAEVASLHLERMPLRPSALNPATAGGLETVLARLLAKDPAARYPNAEAVTADLLSVVDVPEQAAVEEAAESVTPAAETQLIRIDGRDTTAVAPLPPPMAMRPERRPPWLLWAALAGVVVLVLILAIALTSGGGGKKTATVAVPDVVGQTQSQATAALTQLGFVVNPVLAAHETVPSGKVFAEDPVAGSKIKKGSTVTLSVSQGPAETTTSVPPTTATPSTIRRRVTVTTRRVVPTTRRVATTVRPATTAPKPTVAPTAPPTTAH